MIIDSNNYMEGNNALASVLLLYYHIVGEGCFSGDETVYIDQRNFDGFTFLNVEVEDSSEIPENILREGAVIFLLCNLNDMVVEHEESFLKADITKKIISAFKAERMTAIPETDILFRLFEVPESRFDFVEYNRILILIYKKYILGVYKKICG